MTSPSDLSEALTDSADCAEPDLGPLAVRFAVSADDQRSVARVRLVSAGVSAVGAVLLLLADVPIAVFLAAVLALLMTLVWFAQARTAERVARNVERYHLSVYRDGFLLSEGNKLHCVRFSDVREIAVDEERLDIVVTRAAKEPLRIEPRYPGVEIHALVHTLRHAWSEARGGSHAAPAP
jgi:hypothetical protein